MAISAPAAAALVVLVIFGRIGFSAAFLGWLLTLLGAALVARPTQEGFATLARYVDGLRESGETPRQGLDLSPESRRRFGDVVRLDLFWRRRLHHTVSAAAAEAAVLDTLPVPLLLLGAKGTVVRANRAARAMLERDPEQRDIAAVLRDPAVLSAVDAVAADSRTREVEFAWPVGDRELSARVWALSPSVMHEVRLAIVLQDLTTMKRIERMRADFVANASHELRTPLTSLAGFIDTLRTVPPEDTETRERFLEIMEDQTTRMKRVVGDLLSLSEIETAEHTPPSGRVDLTELLPRVVAAMEPAARARNVAIELSLADPLPAVPGDADQIFQVVQNLIDNAVKYGDSDSVVSVSAGLDEGAADTMAIAVADRGYGIPREHLDRLTERFYRVDAARSRRLGGTGLGLAIVKHVLNRHRGQLAIESTPGQGSRFTIRLPTRWPEGEAATKPSSN